MATRFEGSALEPRVLDGGGPGTASGKDAPGTTVEEMLEARLR